MNILEIIAFIYFVPAICVTVYHGFKHDKEAVKKGLRWPKDLYDWTQG